jgi:hypothetical protein
MSFDPFIVKCAPIEADSPVASTFVPKGAFSFNPKALGTITTGGSPDQSDSEMDSIVGGERTAEIQRQVALIFAK